VCLVNGLFLNDSDNKNTNNDLNIHALRRRFLVNVFASVSRTTLSNTLTGFDSLFVTLNYVQSLRT
jgi:hypothetical protein